MDTTPSSPSSSRSSSGSVPARPGRPRGRALVLGGGGSTGNAWLLGVVAGLSEAGLDMTADTTVGTSAGSTAAAQLAGATPAELFAAALQVPTRRPPRTSVPGGPARSARSVADRVAAQMERTRAIVDGSADVADMRRRLGAAALELDADPDGTRRERWRATVAARLPRPTWPRRQVLITAVDAATGDPVVFDRHSGVDLIDAVAASCSSGAPYRIGDAWYIDGGYRTNAENADLAAGHARVLVLSPFGGRTRTPPGWRLDLASQVEALRAGGSRVATIVPDEASEHLFGPHAMDLSLRPAAARAGRDRGLGLAEQLGELWG